MVALSLKGVIIQAALTGTGNLCGYVSNGIKEIAALRLTLAASKAYFDRIIVHGGGDALQPDTDAAPVRDAIAVEGVSFRYDKRPILQDLSLQFKKGGKYALTGPSGCGKSTLLKSSCWTGCRTTAGPSVSMAKTPRTSPRSSSNSR